MNKKLEVFFYSIGGFILFLYLLIGSIAYYCVFNTKIDWDAFERKFSYLASFFSGPNVPVEQQKQNKDKPVEEVNEIKSILEKSYKDFDIRWLESTEWNIKMYKENKVEKVEITSFDNLKLRGFLYKTENFEDNNKFALLAHGYGANHKCHIDTVKDFYDLGFNVLVIDERAYGESEGNYTSLGWKERKDLKDWTWYIAKRFPKSKIVTWGISMGAATVLLACGEDMPDNFKLCIADCPFNSFYELLYYLCGHTMGLPSILSKFVLSATSFIAKIRHKTNIRFSVQDTLKKSKVPILFFHGDSDTFIPLEYAKKMYDSYKNDHELVVVKYAGHCQASVLDHDKYIESIKNFCEKYLNQ